MLNLGSHCLTREKFARRHLLQCSGMKDMIYPDHHVVHRPFVAYVADVEFDFRVLVLMPHIVLLLFVLPEDPDLFDLPIDKRPQHGIAKRTRATSNK